MDLLFCVVYFIANRATEFVVVLQNAVFLHL